MMRQPTMVYGVGSTSSRSNPRLIVACASVAEAGRLIREQYSTAGYSDHYVRNYGSPTGNANEIAVAMAMPRTVFLVNEQRDYFKNLITGRAYETYLAVRDR